MVSDLEKLTCGLKAANSTAEDNAERLASKIKSDPQIHRDLDVNGQARIKDDAGRTFVVKRKSAAAGAFVRR
jgi:hypothetical protein